MLITLYDININFVRPVTAFLVGWTDFLDEKYKVLLT